MMEIEEVKNEKSITVYIQVYMPSGHFYTQPCQLHSCQLIETEPVCMICRQYTRVIVNDKLYYKGNCPVCALKNSFDYGYGWYSREPMTLSDIEKCYTAMLGEESIVPWGEYNCLNLPIISIVEWVGFMGYIAHKEVPKYCSTLNINIFRNLLENIEKISSLGHRLWTNLGVELKGISNKDMALGMDYIASYMNAAIWRKHSIPELEKMIHRRKYELITDSISQKLWLDYIAILKEYCSKYGKNSMINVMKNPRKEETAIESNKRVRLE